MFVDLENISYILFELTLFFLLSIVLYKLFKQAIQPALYDYINKTKKYWQNLNNKKNLLAKTKQKTINKIQKQKKVLDNLENKIKKWHIAILEIGKKEALEKEKLIKEILKKRERKKKELHIIKLQQEVIPKSVELAHKEIQKKYSSKTGYNLFEKLIIQLEIKIS